MRIELNIFYKVDRDFGDQSTPMSSLGSPLYPRETARCQVKLVRIRALGKVGVPVDKCL